MSWPLLPPSYEQTHGHARRIELASGSRHPHAQQDLIPAAHWPIWIFVFFIAPGPLTFDLFERGFDTRMMLWLASCWSAPASPAFRPAAGRRAGAVHHPLHRGSAQPALSPHLLHGGVERSDRVRAAQHRRPGLAIVTGEWRLKQMYEAAYFPIAGTFWCSARRPAAARQARRRGWGHERRYFYGSVWAVASPSRSSGCCGRCCRDAGRRRRQAGGVHRHPRLRRQSVARAACCRARGRSCPASSPSRTEPDGRGSRARARGFGSQRQRSKPWRGFRKKTISETRTPSPRATISHRRTHLPVVMFRGTHAPVVHRSVPGDRLQPGRRLRTDHTRRNHREAAGGQSRDPGALQAGQDREDPPERGGRQAQAPHRSVQRLLCRAGATPTGPPAPGFALGGGFRHDLFDRRARVVFEAGQSFRNYNMVRGDFSLPRLARREAGSWASKASTGISLKTTTSARARIRSSENRVSYLVRRQRVQRPGDLHALRPWFSVGTRVGRVAPDIGSGTDDADSLD